MADTIHGVVRLDSMMGTTQGTHLASVEYTDDLDNGSLVTLNGLKAGSREIYNAKVPTASAKIGEIYLVAGDELLYEQWKHDLNEFYTPAGTPVRTYKLHTGDIYSVTKEALDGVTDSTAVGNLVEMQAGLKAKVVATATSGSTTIGKIIAIDVVGSKTYYVVRVD